MNVNAAALSPSAMTNPNQWNPFSLSKGVLKIQGTTAADYIRVWERGNGILQAELQSRYGTKTARVRKSRVSWLDFHGSSGDDKMVNYTDVRSRMLGGSGADKLYGGSNYDLMYGESGDDLVSGRGGNDKIYGGYGNDRVYGGTGNDKVYGQQNNDRVYGYTGDDYLSGGSGDDYLSGSYGDDTIRGWSGNDRLYGGSGNDYLNGGDDSDTAYGGSGNDRINGSDGSDRLWGESGHDYIWGGYGDDRLIGGAGNDYLMGESGADGLMGGNGVDRIWTGFGRDRVLRTTADYVQDFSKSYDAEMRFRGTSQYSVTLNGKRVTFAGDRFSEKEIMNIDDAFYTMYRRTGSTRILNQSNGQSITYYRHGGVVSGPTNFGGWNSGGKDIHFVNNSFSSYEWLQQVVFHEVGHTWDDPSENGSADYFRGLSGWKVQNGRWTFRSGANNFVRRYGMNSPQDDFATALAAYFMKYAGLRFSGSAVNSRGAGYSAAPRKMSYISWLLNRLK